MAEALLETRGIVKDFPGVRALGGVDLEVVPGEVHCLLGQNGAGKSTLIKILAGAQRADGGSMLWRGSPVSPRNPGDSMRLGIATIYQELDLVGGLSIADNIYLGHEVSRFGFTRRPDANRAARGLLERLGHGDLDPAREVDGLPAALKQIVSMARALSHDARLIVMDEPSAVLASDEVEGLFRVIRQLTAQDIAVIYISHRLDEIREVGDRVTVLKDGETVASGLAAADTPTSRLTSLMTGRNVEYEFPQRPDPDTLADRDEMLRVEHLSRHGEFEDVSFAVRTGEILGIAGLVGAGRSEILETVYGRRKPAGGHVTVGGRHLRAGSVRAAVRMGMGLAPEERKSQALVGFESIARNVTLASLHSYSKLGWVDRRREHAVAEKTTSALELQPADVRREVRTLSGGNQQKAVIARWLLAECKVMLLDEPTRGVDVGARAEIYALIRSLADSGVAVVLVSSEIPEVLGLADNVLVLREGSVVAQADAREIDEGEVLDLFMEGSPA